MKYRTVYSLQDLVCIYIHREHTNSTLPRQWNRPYGISKRSDDHVQHVVTRDWDDFPKQLLLQL